jgi:hypothetical protein
MMRRNYALKLMKRKTNFQEFGEVQNTIDNGHCILDGPRHLAFLYVKDKIKPIIYFLLLKTDSRREELWLVTFHKIKKKQFTGRIHPDRILRYHMEDEFMG